MDKQEWKNPLKNGTLAVRKQRKKLHYITSPNPTLNAFLQGLLGTRQGFGYRAFWFRV
jgi:hypothetical protein